MDDKRTLTLLALMATLFVMMAMSGTSQQALFSRSLGPKGDNGNHDPDDNTGNCNMELDSDCDGVIDEWDVCPNSDLDDPTCLETLRAAIDLNATSFVQEGNFGMIEFVFEQSEKGDGSNTSKTVLLRITVNSVEATRETIELLWRQDNGTETLLATTESDNNNWTRGLLEQRADTVSHDKKHTSRRDLQELVYCCNNQQLDKCGTAVGLFAGLVCGRVLTGMICSATVFGGPLAPATAIACNKLVGSYVTGACEFGLGPTSGSFATPICEFALQCIECEDCTDDRPVPCLGTCCAIGEPCTPDGLCGCSGGAVQCSAPETECSSEQKCGSGQCLEGTQLLCCSTGVRVGVYRHCCHSNGCHPALGRSCADSYGSSDCCASCNGGAALCGGNPQLQSSYAECIAKEVIY